jgi:hypothetical protein
MDTPQGEEAFIVFGGMGASVPIIAIHSFIALPIQNREEPKRPHVKDPAEN